MPSPLVVLNVAAGTARIAATTVTVRARPGGALEFGGGVIRPLRFGERWRVLDGVAAGESTIGATVLAQASEPETVAAADRPATDDEIAQVLALHLAGARPDRTVPGFAAQLGRLVAAGWTARDVFDADADLVDVLTADTSSDPAGDGWTSIVLVPAEAPTTSVAEVLRMLEHDLLDRLAPENSQCSPTSSSPAHPLAPAVSDYSGPASGHPDRPTIDQQTGVGAHRTIPPEPVGGPHSPRGYPGRASCAPASASPATGGRTDAPLSFAENRTRTEQLAELAARNPQPRRPHPTPPPTECWPATMSPGLGRSWTEHPPSQPGLTPPVSAPHPLLTAATDRRPVLGHAAMGQPSPYRASYAGSSPAPAVVEDDPAASRTAPVAASQPAGLDAFSLADQLATLLDEESDLRGLRR